MADFVWNRPKLAGTKKRHIGVNTSCLAKQATGTNGSVHTGLVIPVTIIHMLVQ